MRIVADDKIPFLKGVLEPFAEIVYLPGDQISAAALKKTDALLTRSITKCNAELLHDTSVKLIASATIGDDHIDKKYCAENDIKWETAKGCNAGAVEQYVISAILHLAQKNNFELKDLTIGIIGVGNIGSRVARIAKLLGMKVLLNDPPRERKEGSEEFVSLNQVLSDANIITFHVPLIIDGEDKTRHIADESFFKNLSKNCILINTSRGEVVKNTTLKQAISEGIIKKLVLDVWENEPDLDEELLSMVDIATPHIAGYSLKGKAMGTSMTVQAVSKYFNLGIDNWFPPLSFDRNTIIMDGSKLSDKEIISQVFENVYPIQIDDTALRNNPRHFESLRRDYVFRKENDSFILNLKNVNSELISLLEKLGFVVKTIK